MSVVTAIKDVQSEMAEKRQAIAAAERRIEQLRQELGMMPGALYDTKARLRLVGEDERHRRMLEADIADLTTRIPEETKNLQELEEHILPRLQRALQEQELALQHQRHVAHERLAQDPAVSGGALSEAEHKVIEATLLSDEEFVRQWNEVVGTLWEMVNALGHRNGFRARHEEMLRASAGVLRVGLRPLPQPLPTTEALLVQLRDGIVPAYRRALETGEHAANEVQIQAYASTSLTSAAVSSPEGPTQWREAITSGYCSLATCDEDAAWRVYAAGGESALYCDRHVPAGVA